MKNNFKGKYQLIPFYTEHPDWIRYMVAVPEGYESFELEEDFNSFLKEYREEHKNDTSDYIDQEETNNYVRSLPECRKIGFVA